MFAEAMWAMVEERDAEIARLRYPWRAVDQQDWDYILSTIGYGGRDQFWKAVLTEMREALEQSAPSPEGVTEKMVNRALHAWFASPPSETDQGLERSMKAALEAALT